MAPGHDLLASPPSSPVDAAVTQAHHVLPDQGPIGVFIHHNTLHAFQHLPFHEAVQKGAAELGARPYLSLVEFRRAYTAGRIEDADVDAELDAELGVRASETLLLGMTRRALWRAFLLEDVEAEDSPGFAFALAESTSSPQTSALWAACRSRVERGPGRSSPAQPKPRRHRDALLALDAEDTDIAVHAELVRLGASFLDQGQARAALPQRENGFLAAVTLLHAAGARAPRSCAGADRDLVDARGRGLSAREVVLECLHALGVDDDQVEPVLFATALALPGWAGMFSRLERHPQEDHANLKVSLLEFLAVRLAYERRAVEHACRAAGLPSSWPDLRARAERPRQADPHADASILFAVARAARAATEQVAALADDDLHALWSELASASPLVRQRLWQEAYERRYRRQILDGLCALRTRVGPEPSARPRAQFVFCIDEREESIRRAIEEQGPDYVTFGTAGFFGVAIDYQGLYDRKPAPHAPVVVTPGHEVHETPLFTERDWHERRARMRHSWHGLERTAASGSRSLVGGAGASLLFGPFAGLLAGARVIAPRGSLLLRESVERWLIPLPLTRLLALRPATSEEKSDSGKPVGFSLDEASDRVAGTLKNIGLTAGFAPVVLILGHGSTSLNNPHESAHDCGACGGRRGGANARLFAELANRADVREGVKKRGIEIPSDTWFVGALHDTSDDAVHCYDLGAVPAHCEAAFTHARSVLEGARRLSAHERCRRFEHAPLGLTPENALGHVEGRASHLAQPRPEYGHCTNAVAIVGRRRLSRGLFLDRRAFLVSYDPSQDTHDAILERILAAVGPVGAGISLEYYFSSVDNEVFGCGTKLPHNVTGLLGVMNGHQGDLRTGLPLQMVELHEPMRLLLIVEATPESLLAVASRQAEVRELVVNRWVQLVSVHPDTGAMSFFEKESALRPAGFIPYEPGKAVLREAECSRDWYGASRDHLSPALVVRSLRTNGNV